MVMKKKVSDDEHLVANNLIIYFDRIRGCRFLDFQEAFQLFDQKGDGRVQVSQIGDILRALGQNPTESDVKKLTHNHRPGEHKSLNGSSQCKQLNFIGLIEERITFEVFLPILQTICKNRSSDTAEDFIEGLRHFDKDGNGYISSAELRHLLTTLGNLELLNCCEGPCFKYFNLMQQVRNSQMRKSNNC